jgi:TonB family protein
VLGTLLVDSEPAGASVSVNGEPRGVTPLRLAELPLGPYALLIERAGYQPFSQTVTLSESGPAAELRPVLLRASPVPRAQATLTVLSTPFGASVSLDGTTVGQTPLTNLRVRPGLHQVELRKAGYEPWSRTLEAVAGQEYKLDAPLKPLPVVATPTPVATLDPARVYANTAAEVDTPARKLSGATASYPRGAPRLRSGDSVSVRVSFVVDEGGRVGDVSVVESGGKLLDEAVVSTVKTWTYAPAVKRGVKVKVRIELRQTFRAG